MNNFTIIKRGYSQLEVDSYITRIKADYEAKLAEQKDRIFYLKDQLDKITSSSDNELMTSLVGAVERARLIENSSKNIYELETKRLELLYSKMEKILDSSGPENFSKLKKELLKLIEDCKQSLKHNITMQKENMNTINTEDPVRRLLSKMITMRKSEKEGESVQGTTEQPVIEKQERAIVQKQEQSKVKEQKSVVEKKHVSVPRKIEKPNEFSDFLKDDNLEFGNNFENIMFKNDKKHKSVIGADLHYPTPNESGFDLKEAVNPKDELDEIMKAFDFYSGSDD